MESLAAQIKTKSASLMSVIFELRLPEEICLSRNTGYVVYGAFLDLVRQTAPALAVYLHSASREKPFTLSGLSVLASETANGSSPPVSISFRVTGFSKEITSWLARCLENPPSSIDLLGREMQLIRIAPSEPSSSVCTTFEELYGRIFDLNVELPRRLSLGFLTPTAFRSGRRNILFPVPGLVFRTLSQKWNTYAPIDLGEMVPRLIDETVRVSRYRLRTQMLRFDDYPQIGFTGEVSYLISKDLPDLWVRAIHLLADFAFYAGVGYKTTMGMGQVRTL